MARVGISVGLSGLAGDAINTDAALLIGQANV